MKRNVLYLVIGVLVVVTVVIGYQLYQERQKTTGVEISVGQRGISIEKK
jgi:predicted negative regulator of RcsB-dependent stress response